ncbi:magnetosome protein Mad9 [Candidatus Magnetomorum sp. HK-1]|nr:magnetosome protein Mad9 [Candidatus Magnetomorum sp. HK-1]
MAYKISTDCIGCGTCARKCPEDAISGEKKVAYQIEQDLCIECGTCFNVCPRGAVIDPWGKKSPKKGKRKRKLKACIDAEVCACCKNCYMNCPQEAVSIIKKGFFSVGYCKVDPEICVGCGTCLSNCITGAIALV